MVYSRKFLLGMVASVFCVFISGCSDSSTTTGPSVQGNNSTPFSFHKPVTGATFTMRVTEDSAGRISNDTSFIYTVTNDAANAGGKINVVEMQGGFSFSPFDISYHSTGDIEVLGGFDIIYGAYDHWLSFPLTTNAGIKVGTYFHDSLISVTGSVTPDTRAVTTDTFKVIGKENLLIKGQQIECIKAQLVHTYTLTDLQFGFVISSPLTISYWYAPSIGYWAKEEFSQGPFTYRYQLIDFQ